MDRFAGNGEIASFLLGTVYIALVLFIPYGIVGTWRAKAIERQQGWQHLLKMFGIESEQDEEASDVISETTSE